ncbi:MAG: hypothetical protein LBG15_02490, partial [Dysgonamonadaceae bacterium]|nr:hypothetical protein [Dysgonamonadaceae bacterium]
MKKYLFILIAINCFSFDTLADRWIGSSFIIFNEVFYRGSKGGYEGDNGEFNSKNLGVIEADFTLGGEVQVYDGYNVDAKMGYKIEKGAECVLTLPYIGTDGNNSKYQSTGENVSIAGLAAGSYNISVWFYQTSGSEAIYDSNGGHNYVATFTVPPFNPVFHGTSGENLLWSKSNTNNALVVQTTNLSWNPIDGTSYSGGENLHEDVTFIYLGSETSCSLGNGEGVYKIYSVDDNNNYSS